jgi:hypothetical protein
LAASTVVKVQNAAQDRAACLGRMVVATLLSQAGTMDRSIPFARTWP